VTPYYADESVQLWHGDCREITAWLEADVLVTDPPYGIAYNSGSRRDTLAASIAGDEDTSLRDWALEAWGRSALVFGTWRIPRPVGTHTRLIWDTKGALGMGNLAVPWKPSDQEIYVIGYDFTGRRDSNVLRHAPVQSMARNGRGPGRTRLRRCGMTTQPWLPPSHPGGPVVITPRMADVLTCLHRGLSNKEISRELFISIETVKSWMKRLLREAGARDRAHLVAITSARTVIVHDRERRAA
jgi:DNA-binding CsgD family transcriptional regulator